MCALPPQTHNSCLFRQIARGNKFYKTLHHSSSKLHQNLGMPRHHDNSKDPKRCGDQLEMALWVGSWKRTRMWWKEQRTPEHSVSFDTDSSTLFIDDEKHITQLKKKMVTEGESKCGCWGLFTTSKPFCKPKTIFPVLSSKLKILRNKSKL